MFVWVNLFAQSPLTAFYRYGFKIFKMWPPRLSCRAACNLRTQKWEGWSRKISNIGHLSWLNLCQMRCFFFLLFVFEEHMQMLPISLGFNFTGGFPTDWIQRMKLFERFKFQGNYDTFFPVTTPFLGVCVWMCHPPTYCTWWHGHLTIATK